MTDLQAILDKGGPWDRAKLIGGQLLIQGDCREVMAVLPKVDAVVTDPPYGINYKSIGSVSKQGRKVREPLYGRGKSIVGDDEFFDPSLLLNVAEKAIIWGANHFADKLPPSPGWLVWDKRGKDFYGKTTQSDCELAWASWLGSARLFLQIWNGIVRQGVEASCPRYHPTQKPIALMEWCLGFLPDAQTILDPFAGSGTVAVACQRLGRQSISIELDPDYFDIACRRVDEAARQPALFAPEPQPKPQQEPLL